MAGIDIDGITKSFGRTAVLHRIDLSIAPGEFLTLVGPSGCGKSTLLRIIAGLETASGGSLRIDGARVEHRLPRDRDLAMVFQSYALYPHLSVADNIAVPLRQRRLTTLQRWPLVGRLLPGTRTVEAGIRAEIESAAAMLGIHHLLDRKPGQLSGGQRQRVALGRAMVRHPKAFLMDEPLSNLDAKLRVHMRSEIAQLHRRLGTTFIYVTHDQAEAMTMSDRIAVMMDGEILQVASPDVVYADPADLRVAEFIGSPKVNVLPGRVRPDGSIAVTGGRVLAEVRPAETGALVTVAFRPEHACLVPPERAALRAVVSHVENLGSDLLVHARAGGEVSPDPLSEALEAPAGHALVVRVAPDTRRPAVGEVVGLDLTAAPLLFDDTGRRLRPAGAAPAVTPLPREGTHG